MNKLENHIDIEDLANRKSIASKINSNLIEQFPNETLDKLNSYMSYCVFVIKNTGNLEIKDAVLELPFNGHYFIRKANMTEIEMNDFQSNIALGNIRANNVIKVSVWYEKVEFDLKKSQITFPEGNVIIDYPFYTNR